MLEQWKHMIGEVMRTFLGLSQRILDAQFTFFPLTNSVHKNAHISLGVYQS